MVDFVTPLQTIGAAIGVLKELNSVDRAID